jgi:hypothetical protein
MTYFNPLVGPLAQSPQAQRLAAADKERQVARAQALAKNAAAEGDRFEHTVESPDAVSPAGDDAPRGGRQQQQPRRDQGEQDHEEGDEKPRLDVTG